MAYNQLDIYHRAFKEYKRELEQRTQVGKFHKAICCASVSSEKMKVARYKCEVMTDWIEYIESHLIYIEKAILENRQFILQQGETQLIEKAKRVSKVSVEHLAQHSEMITHVPEPGEDLIPDKLYIVENDSNFAVYENRFLYMLLLDLNDFVEEKYNRIVEWWNKYRAELLLHKDISVGKRKIEFRLSMKEESINDQDTTYDEEIRQSLVRINQLQGSISAFLQTPLMREVSHAPVVKPPITRTNVLKMDINFRMAVELYDYLCAYDKDGYTVHAYGEDRDRFTEAMEADYAELVALSSYLTYRYGGQLEEVMEQRYEQESRRLFGEEDERRRADLLALKAKLESGECTVEEYVHALEARNLSLEQDRTKLNAAENRIADCQKEIGELNQSREQLYDRAVTLEAEIHEQKAILREEQAKHQAAIERMEQEHEQAMREQKEKYDELQNLQLATQAQLHAVRYQQGLMSAEEDYSSKEMLGQLEKEREAFDKLFNAQWKSAKKRIRKNAFGRTEPQANEPDGNDTEEN